MRDLKGDWRDIFNGFMLALDLRKMFLAFCGIIFTVFGIGAVTAIIGNTIDPEYVTRPDGFRLHSIYQTVAQSWHVIFTGTNGHPSDWKIYVPYSIFFSLAFIVIWSYFGGAICRIAAYEIAKDGERIETARALRFSAKKFWSFFWAPLICVIGFAFFFLCNFIGGLIGKAIDIIPYAGVIGAPLVSILLPLAILSGFIMTLILLGTVAGAPLFGPAVAAEGTDSFDAVSRGFSYVYSRPWHYIGYQFLSLAYGYVCIGFVILFAVTMCHIGIKAGAAGFDLFGVWQRDHYDHIADASWGMILSEDHQKRAYNWDPVSFTRTLPHRVVRNPGETLVKDPYGRLQHLSTRIVKPNWKWKVDKVGSPESPTPFTSQLRMNLEKWSDYENELRKEKDPKKRADIERAMSFLEAELVRMGMRKETVRSGNEMREQWSRTEDAETAEERHPWKPTPGAKNPKGHQVAVYILTAWLIVILGMALGYPIAYFFSQQTMIYFVLRKKVDGIEMNEVYEDTDDEERMPEPIAPPKPAEPPPAAPSGEQPK